MAGILAEKIAGQRDMLIKEMNQVYADIKNKYLTLCQYQQMNEQLATEVEKAGAHKLSLEKWVV